MLEAFLIYFCAVCAFPIRRWAMPYEVVAFFLPLLIFFIGLIVLRLKNGQPLVPPSFNKIPVFWFLILHGLFCFFRSFRSEELVSSVVGTAYQLLLFWFFIYAYASGPRKPAVIFRALMTFCAIASFYAIAAILLGFKFGLGSVIGSRLSVQSGDLGDVFSCLFIIAFAFLIYGKKKPLTTFCAVAVPLAIASMIVTQSRGALFGTMWALLFMLYAREVRPRYFVVWLAAMSAVLFFCAHTGGGTDVIPSGSPLTIAFALSTIWLPLCNSRFVAPNTKVAAINTAALGLIVSRFAHGPIDDFWGYSMRNLVALEAIGITLFVQLWIEHRLSRSLEISLH